MTLNFYNLGLFNTYSNLLNHQQSSHFKYLAGAASGHRSLFPPALPEARYVIYLYIYLLNHIHIPDNHWRSHILVKPGYYSLNMCIFKVIPNFFWRFNGFNILKRHDKLINDISLISQCLTKCKLSICLHIYLSVYLSICINIYLYFCLGIPKVYIPV